jgi:hypothetical protein
MYPKTGVVFAATIAIGMIAFGAHGQERQLGDCAQPNPQALLAKGCAVLDDFMEAFNARDGQTWAKTLNFPHVRIAAGEVRVWNTSADYAQSSEIGIGQLAQTGWSRSTWDYRRLVQLADTKLHFLVQFSRYGENGQRIASYEALYIVTLTDGHWGVQARSSFAGIVSRSGVTGDDPVR